MNIIDVFNSNVAELPKTRSNNDFEDFVREMFDAYLHLVYSFTSKDYVSTTIRSARPLIKNLCQKICDSLAEYFAGLPHASYNILKSGITAVQTHVNRLCSSPDIRPHLTHLYRVRLKTMAPLGRSDLFHIPFELRHLVRTQRYSIPGLPCLYFGGSLWVCWEELGRPEFHRMQMSRFTATAPTQVLDFGYRPALFAAMMAHDPAKKRDCPEGRLAASYAICWPLIAACSVRVLYAGSAFVPEYVVPQQMLQWVTHTANCHGIRYFSTHVSQYPNNPNTGANYVFPVKSRPKSGHCQQLRQLFELSEPIAWELLIRSDLLPSLTPNLSCKLELIPEYRVDYSITDFGVCEGRLAALPTARL